jgi:alpha-methylacyl-CoA racemase
MGVVMGPLEGLKIIEISGIGPGPFGAMMLADMGAEVIRVERPGGGMFPSSPLDFLSRGRRCISIDLKRPEGIEVLLRLVEGSDALLEGFRPGVMERLGAGPDVCLERNPRLVYGRMTGWGREGPMADVAGHDINYIALAGALHPIGRRGERPTVPLNLVGDFGGGGMLLVFGMVCALLERERSGRGQVVDAAMIDGASILMTVFHAGQQGGFFDDARGTNLLDSGAHFYDSYETKDGRWISLGAFEPHFYALLLEKLGLDPASHPQMDRERWAEMTDELDVIFKQRTRDEWCELLEGTDVCFAPVLTLAEAREHPHNVARGVFIEENGVSQPRPAPRFSRTDGKVQRPPAAVGEHTDQILASFGFAADEIATLRANKAVS